MLKLARDRLKKSTRVEFEKLVYDAMLTPLQEEVLRFYICKDIDIVRIAERIGYSDSGIRKILNQCYEKVAKLWILNDESRSLCISRVAALFSLNLSAFCLHELLCLHFFCEYLHHVFLHLLGIVGIDIIGHIQTLVPQPASNASQGCSVFGKHGRVCMAE